MKSRIGLLLALVHAMAVVGCGSQPEALPRQGPRDEDLGKVITVVGTAQDFKMGTVVECQGGPLWLDGLDRWPGKEPGRKMRVTGKLVKRHDLPVFIHKEGEPQKSGMPMPPGTDLTKASARYLLEKPTWKLAE